jgi:hypothetical protein
MDLKPPGIWRRPMILIMKSSTAFPTAVTTGRTSCRVVVFVRTFLLDDTATDYITRERIVIVSR